MRLLDRYLLRELLVPLGFCLAGFLIFWISSDLFTELEGFQQRKLKGLDVAAYYVVKTPEFLVTVVPVALLLALLYALTHHARHHELTAIRAAGVGLWRMCLPYLAVGVTCSLGLLLLNELWVPDTEQAAQRVLERRAGARAEGAPKHLRPNLAFENARDRRAWQIGSYDLRTAEMVQPKVDWTRPDGTQVEIIAHRAAWTNGAWTFYEVLQHTYAPGGQALTNRAILPSLAMPEFRETPQQIRSEIRINERRAQGKVRRADIPLVELLDYLRLHPGLKAEIAAWTHTMLHGRLATPWACLVVVLIAVPFGAAGGRRNVFVGVASSILICFGYFVLQQLGLALGFGGKVPPWLGAWMPNLAVAGLGLWLASRVR